MCFFLESFFLFSHFLRIFNLDFFRAQILEKFIASRYLVSGIPLTVLDQSLWNSARVFIMVWGYACVFYRVLIFFTFFHILNLDIFVINTMEVYRGRYLLSAASYSFVPILQKLCTCFNYGMKVCMWFFHNPRIIPFNLYHTLNLVFLSTNTMQVYRQVCVSTTPLTLLRWYFWNCSSILIIV